MSEALRDLADGRLCCLNTATLGYRQPIEAVIEAVARHGFGAIVPWRRELAGKEPARIGRQLRDAGLAVPSYCRSTDLPAIDRAGLMASIADNRRAMSEAAALGAASFIMVVGGLPPGSRDLAVARQQVADGVAELLAHAIETGVRLALEPLHPAYAADRSCLNTLRQALDLCELIEPAPGPAPWLGVAIDTYHVWWDPDLGQQIARAGAASRILAYHVDDWLVPTKDLLLDRGMMGDGVIELRRIRALVEQAGYRGPVEVEIFSRDDWWQRAPDETLRVCRERLAGVT